MISFKLDVDQLTKIQKPNPQYFWYDIFFNDSDNYSIDQEKALKIDQLVNDYKLMNHDHFFYALYLHCQKFIADQSAGTFDEEQISFLKLQKDLRDNKAKIKDITIVSTNKGKSYNTIQFSSEILIEVLTNALLSVKNSVPSGSIELMNKMIHTKKRGAPKRPLVSFRDNITKSMMVYFTHYNILNSENKRLEFLADFFNLAGLFDIDGYTPDIGQCRNTLRTQYKIRRKKMNMVNK